MIQNRKAALDAILASEDGTLNLAKTEPGGASRWGVSVDYLTDYHRKLGHPPATIQDVVDLTRDGAVQVYTAMLLDPIRFDELPSGVDYRLADITTNSGMTGGPTLLQLALGMWPLTGKVDDATMAKVKATDPKALILALSAAWITQKHNSENWNPSPVTKNGFGHGWSNRNISATQLALSMVTT